tara:strand:- start:40 stop:549 length:510 start_codon:yes stop_codon:yes gene_type:complete
MNMSNKLKHLSKKQLLEYENLVEIQRRITQRENYLKEKLLEISMTEDLNHLINSYQKRFEHKFQLEEGYAFEDSNIKTDYTSYSWALNFKNFFGIGLLKESIIISVDINEPIDESKKNKSKLVFNVSFTPHFENIDESHFDLSYIQTINIIRKHFRQRCRLGSPKDKTS